MPVINGVYLKDFPALPSSVADANIIPIAISGNQIAYRTTVAGIVTDARVTSKLLTGLSVTGSTILATDTILQAFGKVQNQLNGKVSSVGLTMPAAFNVANSPITSAGTLAVTAAGVASQYIRGDGALADFPTTGGGGSSVSYYLNGSVSQGTFVGNTYYEMNKTPVIGTGTDFTINANGYIAQFITDANDPASLLIPAGNWNVEMYFSASSNGGNPSFYVEVYKYNGTTFTLLGSSSATPEGITNGTAIDIYYTSVGIPETVLTITDRLAIRVYVTHSGRTITLHTEDNHLSEIVTTFSNGLTTLNGLTKQAQYFAVGSTGTDFAIVSSVDTHTFNLPTASASNRGALSSANWTTFNNKQDTITLTTTGSSGAATFIANTLNIPNYGSALSGYLPLTGGTLSTTNTSETLRIVNGGTGYALYVQSNSYFQGDVSFQSVGNSLLKTVSGLLTAAVAGTDYLTPTGSGAGLSGVVLTTTNQSIAGDKTFTGSSTFTGTGTGYTAITISATGSVSRGISVTSSGTSGAAIAAIGLSGANGLNSEANSGNSAIYGNNLGGGWGGNFTSLSGPGVAATSQSGVGGIFSSASANIAEFYGSGGSLKLLINTSGNLSNGTYTYTLPSATGTLALTSALSSYLPLSGGTLTGALSGTSASFSSTGFFGSDIFTYVNGGIFFNGLSSYTSGIFQQSGGSLALQTGGTPRLTIASTGAATFSSANTNSVVDILTLYNPSQTSSGVRQLFNNGYGNLAAIKVSQIDNGAGADDGKIEFQTATNAVLSTKLTILETGNVGIGTTSPSQQLHLSGTDNKILIESTNFAALQLKSSTTRTFNIQSINTDSGALRIYDVTADAERMRITSGGLVGIGTSSVGYTLHVQKSISGNVLSMFYNDANSGADTALITRLGSNCNNTGSYYFTGGIYGVADKIYIYGNGNIVNTNGSYGTLSDITLKENIIDATPKLDDILNLKVRNFNLIGDDTKQIGFIAQEFEQIFPSMIDIDGKSGKKAIKTSVLVPILVKAIQELKAEIDLLKGEPIIPTDNNLE